MEKLQKICVFVNHFTVIAILSVALLISVKAPNLFFDQTYFLIHILGLALIVVIVTDKIAGYIQVYLDPHNALIFTIIQFVCLPFIVGFLVNYLNIPYTIATAIGLATLSPGGLSKNIFKNLAVTACMLFISMYILPTTTQTVNDVYSASTNSHAKMIFLIGGLIVFAIYEIKKRTALPKVPKDDKPVAVYYVEEK